MTDTIALQTVKELINNLNGKVTPNSPHELVSELWSEYDRVHETNNNLNGKVFEEILGYVFTIYNCLPFYMQAKVAFIPNVNYDFIFYDENDGPLSVSAKTSLRERWKQADLEAVALRYVHRNALSYMVTLNETEAEARNQKLGECMALAEFILADKKRFDDLITEINKRTLSNAGSVDIISSQHFIDEETARNRYG